MSDVHWLTRAALILSAVAALGRAGLLLESRRATAAAAPATPSPEAASLTAAAVSGSAAAADCAPGQLRQGDDCIELALPPLPSAEGLAQAHALPFAPSAPPFAIPGGYALPGVAGDLVRLPPLRTGEATVLEVDEGRRLLRLELRTSPPSRLELRGLLPSAQCRPGTAVAPGSELGRLPAPAAGAVPYLELLGWTATRRSDGAEPDWTPLDPRTLLAAR